MTSGWGADHLVWEIRKTYPIPLSSSLSIPFLLQLGRPSPEPGGIGALCACSRWRRGLGPRCSPCRSRTTSPGPAAALGEPSLGLLSNSPRKCRLGAHPRGVNRRRGLTEAYRHESRIPGGCRALEETGLRQVEAVRCSPRPFGRPESGRLAWGHGAPRSKGCWIAGVAGGQACTLLDA